MTTVREFRVAPHNETDLIEVCKKLVRLKQEASALVMFIDDRDLLVCPQCDLQEDVLADGRLITYQGVSPDPQDRGLCFVVAKMGNFYSVRNRVTELGRNDYR